MFELAVRLLAAGGLVLLAGALGWGSFDSIWKVSGFVCFYGFCAYAVELKGKRNSGTAGIAACFDAIAISAYLAAASLIPSFGFLVLAPIAYAAAKHGSLPSAMAPVAAFVLLGADQWANKGAPPSSTTLAQALGVLAIGMLLNHRRIIVTVAKPVLPEQVEPLQDGEPPEAYMELREGYRKLKDMYHDLERKSRRDRHAADLRLAASGDAVRFHRRLAAQLKKLSGAEGLSLYTVSDSAGSMVVRAVEGSTPEGMRQTALHVTPGEALSAMKHSTERALAALASPEEQILVRNVILTHRGRVVGLVSVQGASAENLDQAADVVEGLAPLAGEMIEESQSKRSVEGRLRRAELLYSVASTAAGANTPNSLAARIVKELSELWDLEHISVCWVEGEEAILASVHGQSIRPLEAMSFAAGPGTRGWLETGAPEVVAFDIADDVRCRRAEMSKQRIQSLALEPIGTGDQILGYIAAISSRSGAIDVPIVESLRMVAAEMFQGLLQLEGRAEAPHGLMLPGEFHRRAAASKSGCLVYLEPLRREDTVARYGAPALEIALHQLGHRLRARLPKGGALCRRPEGDFVAHLPDLSELSARNWANEAAATASMIGLPVDENGKRVPLAIRAKVAELDAPEPEAAEAEAA